MASIDSGSAPCRDVSPQTPTLTGSRVCYPDAAGYHESPHRGILAASTTRRVRLFLKCFHASDAGSTGALSL